MNLDGIQKSVNPNWFSITIINLLILGILLLFIKELPENLKSFLIPSLVVYTIGTAIIGNIQGSNFRANFMKDNFREPLHWYWISQIILFLMFLAYLIFRTVI
ncbi:hypothetical protein ACFL23_02290 [Patescibacteria group bacterium]